MNKIKSPTYLIYKITNIKNNKIYVGKTKHSLAIRFAQHVYASEHPRRNDRSILHAAIRKYGKEAFQIELLERCDTEQSLNERERFWIKCLNAQDSEIGYNLADGGQGGLGGPHFAGHRHSEQTKEQMSKSRVGDKNANYGNRWHHTADMKYQHDGEHNSMYGKHHSAESKKKSREHHLGKKAYSNKILDKVIMLYPEEGQKLISADPDWTPGNIHKISNK